MADLSTLSVKLVGDTASFDKSFRASQRLLKEMGESSSQAGLRLSAGVSVPLAGLAAKAIQSAGALEQTSTAFKTLLGSSTAAEQHLRELRAFAATSPFQFTELTDASKRMMALGFSAGEVIPTLRIIGDTASALGKGKEGIDRITLALGQMRAKGVVSAEEINQLAETGVSAWQILAKTLNVTVAEAMKMAEKRMISASVAIPALLQGMNAKFGNSMAAQSQTLLGQWSNFQDRINFTLTDIGTSLAPLAKQLLSLGDAGLASIQKLAAGFASLNPETQTTVIGLTSIVAAAPLVTLAFGQLLKTVVEMRAVLGAAGLAGTVPVVGAAFVAAAASSVIFRKELGEIFTAARDLYNVLPNITLEVKRVKAELVPGKGLVYTAIKEEADKASVSLVEVFRRTHFVGQAFEAAAFAARMFSAAIDKSKEQSIEMGKATANLKKIGDPEAALRMGEQAKQAGELKRQIDAMNTANEKAVEVSRLATLQELIQMEVRDRGRAAIRKMVDAITDFNTFHAAFVGTLGSEKVALQAASTASLDLASAQYQLGLMYKLNAVEANVAEISTDAYKGTIMETDRIMRQFGKAGPVALNATENATRAALVRMIELYKAGKATAEQVQQIGQVYAEAVKDRRTGGAGIDPTEKIPASAKKAKEALIQVSTVTTDLSRGLAKLVFEGGKFGDVMKKVGMDIGEAMLRNVIEKAMKPLLDIFDKLIQKAAKWALDMLSSHIPGIIGGLAKVGASLGGLFGGGAASAGSKLFAGGLSAADMLGNIGGAAAKPAASAAGSLGGAASAAGSGITGIIGAVGGVVSAVSGIIGNFQMAGIGKDTGRMEETLRGILNVLAINGAESIHHFTKASMFANVGIRDYWQTTGHELFVKMSSSLDVIATNSIRQAQPAAAGNSFTFNNGMFLADRADLAKLADMIVQVIVERGGFRR